MRHGVRPGQSWAGPMAAVALAVLGLMAQLGYLRQRVQTWDFQVYQIRCEVCSERVLGFFLNVLCFLLSSGF